MFRLPVCPHCKTIFRYADVKKTMLNRKQVCYHCNKQFKISKIKILILFLIIALFCAIINVFQLYMIENLSFIGLIVTNIIIVTIGVFLIPFFISYKSMDKSKPEK